MLANEMLAAAGRTLLAELNLLVAEPGDLRPKLGELLEFYRAVLDRADCYAAAQPPEALSLPAALSPPMPTTVASDQPTMPSVPPARLSEELPKAEPFEEVSFGHSLHGASFSRMPERSRHFGRHPDKYKYLQNLP